MNVSDFDYELPEKLIAQHPLKDRGASKLLALNKKSGLIEHNRFRDISKYLRTGDVLVLNNTKVIPARLLGWKKDTGARVEIFLLKKIEHKTWECLVNPGKKLKTGAEVIIKEGTLSAKILNVFENGNRLVEFVYDDVFTEILDKIGLMPLPPYIKEELKDRERYQTVYAKTDGSVAAPTAGLHFTKDTFSNIKKLGVSVCYVTLHVGLGTFRPVKEEVIENHKMHSEFFSITKETANVINRTKSLGRRVIAVGTTTVRTLESATKEDGTVIAQEGETDIFIYPGYKFKTVDAMITNFHLPQSTLLMLVSAFAGRKHVMHSYEEAIKEGYRFFSFGDAMYIGEW